jgi:MinD-like ATPase involved in chromosome partitioning or flagellar assembly
MAIILANEGYKVGILDLNIKGSSVKDLISLEDNGIYFTTWLWKPLLYAPFRIFNFELTNFLFMHF